jgi:hypothetical protein
VILDLRITILEMDILKLLLFGEAFLLQVYIEKSGRRLLIKGPKLLSLFF